MLHRTNWQSFRTLLKPFYIKNSVKDYSENLQKSDIKLESEPKI